MDCIGAIVLAGGRGSRMKKDIPKQYLELKGKPLLWYSLSAFEQSDIAEITLVVGTGEIGYVKENIVNQYGFTKVTHIVEGGSERVLSVLEGLKAMENDGIDYVLVHDGARPMITQDIINRTIQCVRKCKACAVGVCTKDTIKITDEDGIVQVTPNRKNVWCVQTPQAFDYSMLLKAHRMLEEEDINQITDDAMVVERMLHYPVQMIEGAYSNIKITTPEDMTLAQQFLYENQYE